MWWIVILAVIAWILFRFFSDVKEQDAKIAAAGGVKAKYQTLVNWALRFGDNGRIIQESDKVASIRIGSIAYNGQVIVDIQPSFGNVTVVWNLKNSISHDDCRLEWDFPENQSQQMMIVKMEHDIKTNLKLSHL